MGRHASFSGYPGCCLPSGLDRPVVAGAGGPRLSPLDLRAPHLTPDQRDAIQSELLEFGRVPAIKLYREALPDSSLVEATAYIDQLECEWRQRDPQTARRCDAKITRVELAAHGDLRRSRSGSAIVLWVAFPAVRPMGIVFVEGFALGLLFMAVPRLMLGRSRKRSIANFLVMMLDGLFLFGSSSIIRATRQMVRKEPIYLECFLAPCC